MGDILESKAIEHGDRLKIIPVKRLKDLRSIINAFKNREDLNDFQKWIVNEMYQFEPSVENMNVNSIILVAVHRPFYSNVEFYREGEKRTFLSLVQPDFSVVEKYISDCLQERGHSIIEAKNLPLKRLGIHSGLAEYGRNNITYIEGMGSNFSYIAFFSDMECEEDTWGGVRNSTACNKCSKCIENCPTGAIIEGRFLISNQRCLSCINEVPGEFPDWLPATVHHTLYDCLICQQVCPMNKNQLAGTIDSITFSEEETELLLRGEPMESFSKETIQKINILGINECYAAIPRNLKVLFEN